MRMFSTLPPREKAALKTATEAAMHNIRKDLLKELAAVEKNPPGDFQSWLAKVEERYQTWLARL